MKKKAEYGTTDKDEALMNWVEQGLEWIDQPDRNRGDIKWVFETMKQILTNPDFLEEGKREYEKEREKDMRRGYDYDDYNNSSDGDDRLASTIKGHLTGKQTQASRDALSKISSKLKAAGFKPPFKIEKI